MSNTRNVNPIEQHIEKLALLIAIVVLGWVAYSYWFSAPYTIQLGNETVRPGQIDSKILEEAQKLEAELKSPKVPPLLEKIRVPDYNQQFAMDIKKTVLPRDEIVAINIPPFMVPSTGGGPHVPDEQKFHVPQVPTPTMYAVRTELNTLDSIELEQREGMRKYVPVGGPYDFAYASVRAQFDAKTMFDQLVFQPDEGTGIAPLKPASWTQMFWIFDVEVQRQMLQPDGNWSDATTLTAMPGQASVRDKLAANTIGWKPEQIQELMIEIAEKQAEIIQPSPLKMVKTWSPPEPLAEVTPQDGESLGLKEIERQIKFKNNQIELHRKRLQQLNRAGQRTGGTPRGGAPSRGFEEEFDGGFSRGEIGGSAVGGSAAQRRQQAIEEQIQKLTTEIQQLQTQYQQKTGALPPGAVSPSAGRFPEGGFEGEFGPGGFDPTRPGEFDPRGPNAGRPGARGPGALEEEFLEGEFGGEFGGEGGRLGQPQRPVGANVFQFGEDIIELYANDLTVEPGKTYRYRVRVRVYNPLFKQPMIEEQAKKFKEKLTLDSDWSDWSEPAEVEQMSHYFVLNGGTGNARVEVWRFHDGNWRSFEFTVRPGDPVGWPMQLRVPQGNPLDVDFSTGAYTVDIERIEVQGNIRGLNRQTTRALIVDDEQIVARTVDEDRDHPKRKWLQDQQAIRKANLQAASR